MSHSAPLTGHNAADHGGHEHRDYVGAKIGMWLFLLTELVLFAGLFLLYSVFRHNFPHEFHHAAGDLNVMLGAINTVILLTSSLTMVLSITALQKNDIKSAVNCLVFTIACGFGFLFVKFIEWSEKISHGIYPGSDKLMEIFGPGERMFFGLYYSMTGLHGIHVIVGIGLLIFMLIKLKQGQITSDHYVSLENAGLYWHLVDIIWIFLLPLFYLTS
jgi:cytochrome c oxidase subunit 3